MLLFHDWAWDVSTLLDEEQRTTLRTLKAATWDLRLLVRAALLSKKKSDPQVMDQYDGEV